MKRSIVTLISVLTISVLTYGQISGIKSIPGDFSSIGNAISVLNSSGVGAGGVTFNVAANYSEIFTSLTAGLITATGTTANPIVFQRNGSGANPIITGCVTGATGVSDYVICLQGTDYITFNGIDISEPSGVIEWGYAILKNSATDGSQNVTIRNCNIALKLSNSNTVGVYSANITPVQPGVQLTITTDAGTNSKNKFYSNTITGCYSGIIVNGYSDPTSPYAYYDLANEIGRDGGNTINGFGGSTAADYGILTSYQNRLFIANNAIGGSVAGNGTCAGIQLNTANNATVSVYNNTVSIQYSGTGTFYGIYSNQGTIFTDNSLSFYNNIVTNCTCPNATTNPCYYIYNFISASTVNWYNCQVTNNTHGSSGAEATGGVYYMYLNGNPASPHSIDFHDNSVIGNMRIQSTPAGGFNYYMYISGGGPAGLATNVYDNLIDNNTAATTGQSNCFYFLNNSGIKNFYNNTLSNLLSARGIIYGFYTGGGTVTNIFNNRIQNLNSLGTTSTIYGIHLQSSTSNGTIYVYNNYISEFRSPNSTNATAQYGINANATSTTNIGIFYNTVYLDGTSSGSGFGSIGLNVGSSPLNVDVRNNIIINKTIPTGAANAIAFKSAVLLAANLTPNANNNNYFAGTPGANHLIFNDGTNSDQTLAAYKARMFPRECNSITENPPFIQTTTTPFNLHLNPALPTQCESAGQVIGTPNITVDFDNDLRFPNTGYPDNGSYPAHATDLGADEFAGIPLDVTPPAVICTPLKSTSLLTDRTLTATITDVNTIPSTGTGVPQVCWKKNFSGTWNYVPGVFIGNDQFAFTFGSGVTLGDTVAYFIVAQDNFSTPNVATLPLAGSGGYSANPPMASIPPAAPFKYLIIQGICGTKTVGALDKDYPTLTAAINDINGKEITCPVVLELTDDAYTSETYPIVINKIPGMSMTNTLTLRPATGASPVFSTSYSGVTPNYWSMLSLNGAQNIIIDGSNNGGTGKHLTFQNTATTGFVAVIGLYNNGTTAATNITLKNCIVQAHTDNDFNAMGIQTYTTGGNAGFHDLVIHNNTINSAKIGIQITGIVNDKTNNVEITNNIIGDMEPSMAIPQYGIYLTYTNNVTIEGNEIIGAAQGMNVGAAIAGIYINTGSTNTLIKKNIVHDFRQLGTVSPALGAAGVHYASDATSLTEITDNLIYNIKSPGQSSAPLSKTNTFGIYLGSGGNFHIYHNTVYLGGNYLTPGGAVMSSCLTIGNLMPGIDIRNNIFSNSSQPESGNPGSKSYCITIGSSSTFTTIDFNDYYSNGINPRVGSYASVDCFTLTSWQAATNQDANSVSIDPVFISPTNFLPTTQEMAKAGFYFPTLPTDITGITRSNPPDIGAYEYAPVPALTTNAATDVTLTAATLNGTANANGLDANVYFDFGLTTGYGTTINGTPNIISGYFLANIIAPLTGLAENTTYHFRIRSVTFSGVTRYGNDMIFNTLSGVPENITVIGTFSGGSTCHNALNTITIAGDATPFEVQSGASVTMIAGQKISFLPGTRVYNNGYLHAYMYNGTWCNNTDAPVAVAAQIFEKAATGLDRTHFSIFPNPTNSNVTLVQKGENIYDKVKVEVYTLQGERIMTETMVGAKSHDLSLSSLYTGLYFVKIVAEGYVETIKLVKL